jgi:hypothetical protein
VADTLDPVQTRAERLARGWLVGAFATGVAAVSHTLAGGYRPDGLGLAAGLVFSGMLATLAIGRRPSLPRLVIAVVGSQLAFHVLFSLLGGGAPSSPDPTAMPGMQMGHVAVTAPAGLGHVDHLADPSMWIAHAVAGALTILFLRRVERAMWEIARRLVVRLLRFARPIVAVRPGRAPLAPRPRVLPSGLHVAVLPLRGPPLLPSH